MKKFMGLKIQKNSFKKKDFITKKLIGLKMEECPSCQGEGKITISNDMGIKYPNQQVIFNGRKFKGKCPGCGGLGFQLKTPPTDNGDDEIFVLRTKKGILIISV